ncbi:hypothetical protein [Flavobacterium filum]|uniref:hypothetical protein n=1 Tax=Flavobacterium filum TaxID=370974 RepID=UPI0023F3E713|nr:hypothetical protein [Flavobacterium filum]
MNAKFDFRKWSYNGNNYVCQKDGWFLSYNDKEINCDNAPELAIAEDSGQMGILYYADPKAFEDLNTIDEALELGSKLCNDESTPVRGGFWTAYDFYSKQWFRNMKEVIE